jgi:hypothetical protein
MADPVMEKGTTNVKGNNVLRSTWHHRYDLYLSMANKYEDQANNCEAARKYNVSQGKHLKLETKLEITPIIRGNCHLYIFKDGMKR